MNRRVSFGRLQFYQQSIFDDEVRAKGLIQNPAPERYRNDLLSFDKKTFLFQAFKKQYFIDGLKQPRPNILVQVKPAINRGFRNRLKILHTIILVALCLRASLNLYSSGPSSVTVQV